MTSDDNYAILSANSEIPFLPASKIEKDLNLYCSSLSDENFMKGAYITGEV